MTLHVQGQKHAELMFKTRTDTMALYDSWCHLLVVGSVCPTRSHMMGSENHLGWKRPSRSPSLTITLALWELSLKLSAMSTHHLNTPRDGDSTAPQGSPSQCSKHPWGSPGFLPRRAQGGRVTQGSTWVGSGAPTRGAMLYCQPKSL